MYKKPVQPDDTFWRLEVNINPGKLNDFISVAHDLFRTMDAEGGTLGYGYYLNDDKSVCHIHEHYRDSEGLIAHATNFGNVFPERFITACTPTKLTLYGAPNAAAKAIMAQYGAIYFTKIEHYSEVSAIAAVSTNGHDKVFPPGGKSISIPASEWVFHDTGARGVDGVTKIEFADGYGDMQKGKHGSFFRFTPGFVSPLHTHTHDYYAVVIKGEMQNYEVGQKPITMGPGSYWYQRGKRAHTTACVSDTPGEIFIVQSDKFDAQVPPKEE
jgi:quercetin dioxygenase-like cupin family protein